MTAAIYARKSTSQNDVADEAKSVTRQIDGAKAFIAAKGWSLDDAHAYVDDGVSGALFSGRAEFQRLMRDAAAGAFEAIVIFDLDRLGRDGHKTMVALHALADLYVSVWDASTGQQIQLDSFEHRLPTILQAEFAQQYRDQVRKHTKAAMRQKAAGGYVAGGKLFGYDNHRVGKGQTVRKINEAEAKVIVDIYTRFAAGQGLRSIALALNKSGALSPRAQQGRPNGWSATSVREVLLRPAYRGETVYGKTAKAYGRELGPRRGAREKGQIPVPEETWIRHEVPALIDLDLAARVDARRQLWQRRTVEAKTKGRLPQRAHGRYLLSGGMLVCPTCGGHFEALADRPGKQRGVYTCATRRRKPGVCTNTLTLPIAKTDNAVLDIIEGEVLAGPFIEELLSLVDRGEADDSARLIADRERLQREIDNLMDLAASGISAGTLAPKIKEREAEIAKLDRQLKQPRQAPPNIAKLRDALLQRAEAWRADLRGEPQVARMVLRRLVGPLSCRILLITKRLSSGHRR